MIEKIRESFRNGISRIKWFSSVFAERMRIEIAVFRLLCRSDGMEKKRDELIKAIGLRVFELRGNPDRNVLKDRAVAEAVAAAEKVEKEMEELKQKASEMSSAGS